MGISSPLVTSLDPKPTTPATKSGARTKASSSKATATTPLSPLAAGTQDFPTASRSIPTIRSITRKGVPFPALTDSAPDQTTPGIPPRPLPWFQNTHTRAIEPTSPASPSDQHPVIADTTRAPLQDGLQWRVQRLQHSGGLQWGELQRRGLQRDEHQWGNFSGRDPGFTMAMMGSSSTYSDSRPKPPPGMRWDIETLEPARRYKVPVLKKYPDKWQRTPSAPSSTGGDGTSSSGERSRAPSLVSGAPGNITGRHYQTTGGPTVGSRRPSTSNRRSENDDVRTRSGTSDEDAARGGAGGGPTGGQPSPATLSNIHYWRSPRTNQALSVLPLTSSELLERPSPSGATSSKGGQSDPRPTVDQTFDRFASQLPAGGHVRQQTQKFEDQSKSVLEGLQIVAGAEEEAKQGQLQPKRVRSPGAVISKAIQGLEKVAGKAIVESVDAAERIDPAQIQYWKTKRTRSPDAWHELTSTAAEAATKLRKTESSFVRPAAESTQTLEPTIDPTTLQYTRSKRVTNPDQYWPEVSRAADVLERGVTQSTEHAVAPIEERLVVAEQPLDPASITYQKSNRVWEPETYWKETANAVKQIEQISDTATQNLTAPVAAFAEDLIDGPQLSTPKPSYWTSSRTRQAQGPRPLVAMPSVSSALATVNEQSLSEYSGEVSDDPKSPSARPRKSITEISGRRPSLWQTSRQLVSTSTDAGDVELRRRSKQLSKAGDKLNALMDDAFAMAKNAAVNGKPDEVAQIFKHASQTLRHASTLPQENIRPKESSASDLEILWRPPATLASTDPTAKDFAYASTMRRRGRARTEDPAELHHLGLPVMLRTSSLQQSNQPLKTKVSTLADGRRRSSVICPTTMVMQGSPDLTPSSSSPSKDDTTAKTTGAAGQFDLMNPQRRHVSLPPGQGFSLGRHHVRPPTAREWQTGRKRITAVIACMNTVFIGLIAGIYAGEVPRIQYQIANTKHVVIYGNVLLFMGVGLTSLTFWPLPLLHGRKPYTLAAFALMLPLQFPQALAIQGYSDPHSLLARFGLLLPRILTGLAMGFANINLLPSLLDLFGASLQSERPHQELVVEDDIRRQGGGIGLWLGVWTWCYIGSLSVGFCIGACIISNMDPAWGFYLVIILLAFFLFINVVAPETRPALYRRSLIHFFDTDEKIHRRVARGEVKLHISNEGPMWWWEEVWAGLILTKRMLFQSGFAVMALYLGWIYAQVVFFLVLLGALLSRDYMWNSYLVGLASLSFAFGALLAIPLSHANWFSRARWTPQRTDSMTFHHTHYVWTSHMVRRCIFTLTLPLASLAYTVSSPGASVSPGVPIAFVGLVGFLSNLAITECIGIVMETFDTSDLQPGANSKHRQNSLPQPARSRRTNYSSYPRICAGFFLAQGLGFFLAAAATGVSGKLTRALGAQISTAVGAAVLLNLTIGLLVVLLRWKTVQVVPDGVLVNLRGETGNGAVLTGSGGTANGAGDWKPVLIGHPSGKMRRMSLLEWGKWSRWGEIRRLNKLE
ncbi:hypothetical protein B0A48_12320 [Cryoendolithus antarcticus]|uniref:Major facilitator superfamily (MFS) profile domain-containing protein n=1 Tax=Cryoendolithus antarcticus TaxID=1507870 RepID=A0A1V8SRN6_9PEZI|nr:hypothetical protein B0A48_12320 [Cryoendolithus antarcticus]